MPTKKKTPAKKKSTRKVPARGMLGKAKSAIKKRNDMLKNI